ncbi:hypothetical protein BTR23_12425 [Alkalihalophilus pseudofirmus]|nr:hypothetical protein BTR23_12425 [Alkalihalophilus pseudofirmus]
MFKEVKELLITSRNILAAIGVLLSGYILITKNYNLSPYMLINLGIFMVVIGLLELQKSKQSFWGYACIVISLFAFYVSIQGFLI